jgi:hypothetical protein
VNIEEKLAVDMAVFGQTIIKEAILKTFRQRCWGAWKVITGEAGIILMRIDPKKINLTTAEVEG